MFETTSTKCATAPGGTSLRSIVTVTFFARSSGDSARRAPPVSSRISKREENRKKFMGRLGDIKAASSAGVNSRPRCRQGAASQYQENYTFGTSDAPIRASVNTLPRRPLDFYVIFSNQMRHRRRH